MRTSRGNANALIARNYHPRGDEHRRCSHRRGLVAPPSLSSLPQISSRISSARGRRRGISVTVREHTTCYVPALRLRYALSRGSYRLPDRGSTLGGGGYRAHQLPLPPRTFGCARKAILPETKRHVDRHEEPNASSRECRNSPSSLFRNNSYYS